MKFFFDFFNFLIIERLLVDYVSESLSAALSNVI